MKRYVFVMVRVLAHNDPLFRRKLAGKQITLDPSGLRCFSS